MQLQCGPHGGLQVGRVKSHALRCAIETSYSHATKDSAGFAGSYILQMTLPMHTPYPYATICVVAGSVWRLCSRQAAQRELPPVTIQQAGCSHQSCGHSGSAGAAASAAHAQAPHLHAAQAVVRPRQPALSRCAVERGPSIACRVHCLMRMPALNASEASIQDQALVHWC
jgi:hypothetical protein